jgi:hypothetical protein
MNLLISLFRYNWIIYVPQYYSSIVYSTNISWSEKLAQEIISTTLSRA